jgi:7-keto-8-aminopelargonate synthetase-like enzyme
MTERSSARLRNTVAVEALAEDNYRQARSRQLMQLSLKGRDGRRVTLPDGSSVTEFVSCCYLGIDVRPEVVARAQQVVRDWGVHLCCARSRFSIGPLEELEEGLSELWGARAVTFPTVTAAHMSAMPLLPSRELGVRRGTATFLFDHRAHASMQFMKPMLAAEHRVETVPHNDLGALEKAAKAAHARGDAVIYVADGVYSMGGTCPIREVLALSKKLELALYIDDAHGTSIFGARGEGSVFAALGDERPENVTIAFSLSKGYGCNGGGVLLPSREAERRVRTFGTTYAFSAPLDFAVVGAALASLELHEGPELGRLQAELERKVALFDALTGRDEPFSPIRMVKLGDAQRAIDVGAQLKERGHFASVTFFPIVAQGDAMLRLCLGVGHSDLELTALANSLIALGVPK